MRIIEIPHLKKLQKPMLWNLLFCEVLLTYIFADAAYKGLSLNLGLVGYIGFGLCGIACLGFALHSLLVALHIRRRFIEEPA